MEKETKKRKGGAEKEERKKNKLKEIAAKCMKIQEALARASTLTKAKRQLIPLCY